MLGDAIFSEELVEEPKNRGGRYSSKKKKEIFDYDEVNPDEDDALPEEENPYDDDYSREPGHNTFVVILLTIIIVLLLLATGFLLIRFYLPNMMKGTQEETQPTYTAQVQQTEPVATEYAVPCTGLVLTSGAAELTTEGNYHLLNVIALPENTTDKILYSSADESIATVSENGRITAVSEGETVVYITCGSVQQTCQVICRFGEETVPPVTTEAEEPTSEEETTAGETTATTAADLGLKDVTLKLKKTDIILGVYLEFQLKLDCDLEQNEVVWTSEHPHIAAVDEQGVVKALKKGITSITAKYGNQEVSCIVRCG